MAGPFRVWGRLGLRALGALRDLKALGPMPWTNRRVFEWVSILSNQNILNFSIQYLNWWLVNSKCACYRAQFSCPKQNCIFMYWLRAIFVLLVIPTILREEKIISRQPCLMTPKRFEFWRRFSVGLGFSFSVGFAKPTDEGEEEEGDSWHKVSNK